MELSEESAAGNRILRLRDAEAINKRVQKFANITANIFLKIVKKIVFQFSLFLEWKMNIFLSCQGNQNMSLI